MELLMQTRVYRGENRRQFLAEKIGHHIFGYIQHMEKLTKILWKDADQQWSWEYMTAFNGAIYLRVENVDEMIMKFPNGFICEMTNDAAGICTTLMAFNELIGIPRQPADLVILRYHQLSEATKNHYERENIFTALREVQ